MGWQTFLTTQNDCSIRHNLKVRIVVSDFQFYNEQSVIYAVLCLNDLPAGEKGHHLSTGTWLQISLIWCLYCCCFFTWLVITKCNKTDTYSQENKSIYCLNCVSHAWCWPRPTNVNYRVDYIEVKGYMIACFMGDFSKLILDDHYMNIYLLIQELFCYMKLCRPTFYSTLHPTNIFGNFLWNCLWNSHL